MVNHHNCAAPSGQGKALAELIMNAIAGRCGIRINGEIVQSNSLRSKLFVGDKSIPVDHLTENLTVHELRELENLPFWNGNNEYEISSTVLLHISTAINRYLWKTKMRNLYANHMAVDFCHIEEKANELARCLCKECSRDRSNGAYTRALIP